MIEHVVMWNFMAFANGKSRKENVLYIKAQLELLPNEIPGILAWKVGANTQVHDDAFDLILISQFDSWEALETYQNHSAHIRVRDEIRKVRLNRRFVDFESTC